MSRTDTGLPERLRDGGATDLERRLLHAASQEEPSRALSERMAAAIGIGMPPAGRPLGEAPKPSPQTASKAAAASAPLGPWVAGALVAAVVTGAFVLTRPARTPPTPRAVGAAPSPAATTAPISTPSPAPLVAELPPKVADPIVPSLAPSSKAQRGGGSVSGDIADQIALIDTARAALAMGDTGRTLTAVRQYQTRYPKGAFRPEAAAIKIEALVKLGRVDEARALAQRFLAAHGPGPLADRVARVAGVDRP